MTDDLIKRLRQHDGHLGLLVEEAADEIESLQAQVTIAQRSNGFQLLSGAAQRALPEKLTGEIACILEDCGPPDRQSPEALAELIRHYQPTWDRIRVALTSIPAEPAQGARDAVIEECAAVAQRWADEASEFKNEPRCELQHNVCRNLAQAIRNLSALNSFNGG
jgi:hypothetical protein